MFASAVISAFDKVARVRHARVLHPSGRSYRATLRTELFGDSQEHEVSVRISKGAGFPGDRPDVLGIALRLEADALRLDLLVSTAGSRPGTRHLPVPRSSVMAGPYTTLMPYKVHGRTRILALLPAQDRDVPPLMEGLDHAVETAPLAFTLATATLTGPWQPCGHLEIHTPIPDVEAFDPILNNLPALHPAAPLRAVRRLAYTGSRAGRGAASPVPDPHRRTALRS
jgi:hypothetical protein